MLRRIRQRGRRVDLQLCQVSVPEMRDTGVDRILLEGWLRNVAVSIIRGPVCPPEVDPRSITLLDVRRNIEHKREPATGA